MNAVRRGLLASGFLVAVALRIALLARFHGNFDVDSYGVVAAIVRAGGDLYDQTRRYNYAPAWAFIVSGAAWIARSTGISLPAVIGGLLLAVDAATAWLLFRLAGRGTRGEGAALLFFANPVSVIVTGHYLQFDNVAILCLLAAILAARRRPAGRIGAAIALSASLLVKHMTAFFPPLFVGDRNRRGIGWIGAAVPYAAFAASFVPFWRSHVAIRDNVFGYRGGNEAYGVGLLADVPSVPHWLAMVVYLAAVAAAIIAGRRDEDLSRACLRLFLVMLLFTPGINEYYFVWPIALGALFGGAGYVVYTIVATGFLVGGSLGGLGFENPHLPGWHGVWFSLLFWFAWDERRRSILSRE